MKYFNKIKPEILAALIMIGAFMLAIVLSYYPKFAMLSGILIIIYIIWRRIVAVIKFDRRIK